MSADPDPIAALPTALPVFPLNGVLLLPGGQLPLNIFEPRYIAMVEDALKSDRLIGMIQPRQGNDAFDAEDDTPLFDIGCAGRVTAFEETDDGRYLITLTGLCRFKVVQELPVSAGGYRAVETDWRDFSADMSQAACLDLDREKLNTLLQSYFDIQGISCDWDAVDNAPDQKLITCLSMICPFDASEKQALLEAGCCRRRAEMFMTMLEMAVCAQSGAKKCH